MKKEENKLIINSLDEFQELIIKYKRKKIKLFIGKELFIGESIEFFDEEIYNQFEYVVEFEEKFFFAISRELIEDILKRCLEDKIELEGIYLLDEFFPKISDKNFLREEYKQEKKEVTLQKKEKLLMVIISIVFFIASICLEFWKLKVKNEAQREKKELNLSYEKIKELEDFFLENSLEENFQNKDNKNRDFKNFKGVDKVLTEIEAALEDIGIETIEVAGEKVKIIGFAYELQEIYKFERNLYKDFKDVNNDFIKKDKNIYKFIIDFKIKE